MIKLLVLGAAVLLAAAGCSSTDSTSSESPSASASPTETTAIVAPVEVNGRANLKVDVGAALNVTTPDVTKVMTNNATVLKVSQPRDDGSATFNAGAEVIAPGDANLVVYGADDEKLYTVAVIAQDADTITPEPSSVG